VMYVRSVVKWIWWGANRGQAVLDIPCILFAEEMIAAYPDAKVILTERPVEGELVPAPFIKETILTSDLRRRLVKIDAKLRRRGVLMVAMEIRRMGR
jgi:Sulfotransferase domain